MEVLEVVALLVGRGGYSAVEPGWVCVSLHSSVDGGGRALDNVYVLCPMSEIGNNLDSCCSCVDDSYAVSTIFRKQ